MLRRLAGTRLSGNWAKRYLMKMWLKILLFIYSLLVAALLILGSLAFKEHSSLLKILAFCGAGTLFLLSSVTGFFSERNPSILIMPVVLFSIYGLAEFVYVGSGIVSDTDHSVHILHWSILIFLRAVMPFALAWACWRVMQRIGKTPEDEFF